MPTNDPPILDLNAILIAEYNYIAQAAFQANEDRARVSNFYFVTAAAAVAAIVGAKIETAASPAVYLGFSALFATLSAIGVLTLLQLARLRKAWTESAQAMGQIKQYYIDHFKDFHIEEAFAWSSRTIPPSGKRSSVAFLLALSVMIVDAVTAATAVAYFSLALGARPMDPVGLLAALAVGLALLVFQNALYSRWVS